MPATMQLEILWHGERSGSGKEIRKAGKMAIAGLFFFSCIFLIFMWFKFF